MKIVKGEKENPENVYNPALRYTWKPEDVFELNGEQFGLILNTLRNILNTPEAAKVLMADRANQAIEAIMANAVNKGVVKEVKE
jgi:hypothetical protein